jgi:hypothetical protein
MVLLLLLSTGFVGARQEDTHACSFKVWLGRTADFERVLATGEVTSSEEIGVGVMHPVKVTLDHEGQTYEASFKPIKRGRHKGFWESYQAEIAAYELDKMLGLDMVPPTVDRRINGQHGAMQLWADGCKAFGDIADNLPRTPGWSHELSRMKMFDVLIHNADRNAGNILVDPHAHIILIDHSRGFITSRNMLKQKDKLPSAFDRKLVEKLKSLELSALKSKFGDLLMEGQIKAVIERRDGLLEHLDKLIKEKGEALVLFN